MLYYRKDLVPQPPRTWDELLDVGEPHRARARNRRIPVQRGPLGSRGLRSPADVLGAGRRARRRRGRAHLRRSGPTARGWCASCASCATRSTAAPRRDRSWPTTTTSSSPRRRWRATSRCSSAAAGSSRELEAALLAGGIREVGRSPTSRRRNRGGGPREPGGWVWVTFARDPARQRAAAEFLRFVESPENVARISIPTRQLPVRRSVYRDFPVFRENPWYAKFGEMLVDGACPSRRRRSTPRSPSSSSSRWAMRFPARRRRSGGGRRVAGGAEDRRAASARAPGKRARAFDPVRLRPAAGRSAHLRGRARRCRPPQGRCALVARPGARAGHRSLLVYPMLDLLRARLHGCRTPRRRLHLRRCTRSRALLTDPEFRGMVGGDARRSCGLRSCCSSGWGWPSRSHRRRERRRAPGSRCARVAVVSAWVVPGVLVGVLWRILLMENRAGIANYWLSLLGRRAAAVPLVRRHGARAR